MNSIVNKKVAAGLLVLLFFMPVIATVAMSTLISSSDEADQYNGLQVIIMGIYNIPFLLISFTFLGLAASLSAKLKSRTVNIMLILSLAASATGVLFFTYWGVEAISS